MWLYIGDSWDIEETNFDCSFHPGFNLEIISNVRPLKLCETYCH